MHNPSATRVLQYNLKRINFLAILLISIASIQGVINIIARAFLGENASYDTNYLIVYVLLVVINVLTIIYVRQILAKQMFLKHHYFMVQAYIGMMIFFGSVLSFMDAIYYGHIMMYLIIYFLTSMLLISNKMLFLIVSVGASALVYLGVNLSETVGPYEMLYSVFLTSIWIVGLVIQYIVSRSQKLILTQHERLEVEMEKSNQLAIELEKANKRLKNMAYNDALTQLPNRNAFYAYLNELLRKNHRITCTVFVLDIDYFKQYNDFFGHPKGDRVLRMVSDVLKKFNEEEQVYFVRWGGEEFLGITLCEFDQAKKIGLDVKAQIADLRIKHTATCQTPFITVSIGGSFAEIQTLEDFDSIYQLADKALYQVKSEGRNHFILYKN